MPHSSVSSLKLPEISVSAARLADGAQLGVMPYGYYLIFGSMEKRLALPGTTSEDLHCFLQCLKRGAMVDDLAFMFHHFERFLPILQLGLDGGWVESAELSVPYALIGRKQDGSRLVLGANSVLAPEEDEGEGRLQMDAAVLTDLIEKEGIADVQYFADSAVWNGLELLQEVFIPRCNVTSVFGFGKHALIHASTPESPICLECILRWSVGNSRSPVEWSRVLRLIMASGDNPFLAISHQSKEQLRGYLRGSFSGQSRRSEVLIVDQETGGTRKLDLAAPHPSCGRHNDAASHRSKYVRRPAIPKVAGDKRYRWGKSGFAGLLKNFRLQQIGDATLGRYYLASATINTYFSGGAANAVYCFGDGQSKEEAITKCVGEAAERLALFHFLPEHYRCARYEDLKGESLNSRFFSLYSPKQYARPGFPFAPFDPSAEYLWAEVVDAATGERKQIPAEFLYCGCRKGTPPLFQASSVGSATHSTFESALASAILETVERDAMSIAFLGKMTLPLVATSDTAGCAGQSARLVDAGFEVLFLDAAIDFSIPVVLVMAFRIQGPPPFFLKGAAASFSYEEAARKAMGEVWRSFLYYRKWPERLLTDVRKAHPLTAEYNLALYQNPQARERLDFLIGRHERNEARSHIGGLDDLVGIFQKAGMNVFYRDCTPVLVEPAELKCVKAYIPGIVPMSFGQSPWCFGIDRVFTVPGTRGTHNRRLTESDMNAAAHFFS